jgi:hypothetical protein
MLCFKKIHSLLYRFKINPVAEIQNMSLLSRWTPQCEQFIFIKEHGSLKIQQPEGAAWRFDIFSKLHIHKGQESVCTAALTKRM